MIETPADPLNELKAAFQQVLKRACRVRTKLESGGELRIGCSYFLPSAAASAASFANRSDFNLAILSSTARRWDSYSAQAFVPSRACSCFRLKLTSARALASFEFDTITSVYRIADYVTAISPAIDRGKTLLFNG